MRICIFDDVAGGHHAAFVRGLAKATTDRGHRLLVATAVDPGPLADGSEWFPVQGFGAREPLKGRRELRAVRLAASEFRAVEFWDLNVDKNIWALRSRDLLAGASLVLHRVDPYDYAQKSPTGRARAAFLRTKLRRLVSHGSQVVVHTQEASDSMEQHIPGESVVMLGYPVTGADDQTGTAAPHSLAEGLLYVGGARRHKGLELLVQALGRVAEPVHLTVAGAVGDETKHAISEGASGRIAFSDGHVSDQELRIAYQRAALVVLPYLSSFGASASGVLLECLRYGVPAVVTETIAAQLPGGYGGAITVPPDDVDALARGIDHALEVLPGLRRAAQTEGPDFVARHHTYHLYAAGLLGRR